MIRPLLRRWEGRVPKATRELLNDVGLLLLRLGGGAFMLTHGWSKLASFGAKAEGFSDPLGVGSTLSLALAVFAEFFCSLAVLAGLATRLAVIPLITTMGVAAFIVHATDPFSRKELALVYLVVWLVLFLAGPGRFSVDRVIQTRIARADET